MEEIHNGFRINGLTYKPLECPFCHGIDLRLEEFPGHVVTWEVICHYCGIHGPSCESYENAIIAWNSRGNYDKLVIE